LFLASVPSAELALNGLGQSLSALQDPSQRPNPQPGAMPTPLTLFGKTIPSIDPVQFTSGLSTAAEAVGDEFVILRPDK